MKATVKTKSYYGDFNFTSRARTGAVSRALIDGKIGEQASSISTRVPQETTFNHCQGCNRICSSVLCDHCYPSY